MIKKTMSKYKESISVYRDFISSNIESEYSELNYFEFIVSIVEEPNFKKGGELQTKADEMFEAAMKFHGYINPIQV